MTMTLAYTPAYYLIFSTGFILSCLMELTITHWIFSRHLTTVLKTWLCLQESPSFPCCSVSPCRSLSFI